MKKYIKILFLAFTCMAFTNTQPYPIDGYSKTGIKRLLRLERINQGLIQDKLNLPPGSLKSMDEIKLKLLSKKDDSTALFLKRDDNFNKEINKLFYGLDKSYSLSVLDISDKEKIRYAARNETLGYQPGSVGKIAVLHALFVQLAKIYPNSFEKRTELLRTKFVKAGQWGLTDEHTIPIFDPATNKLQKRQVVAADVFNLYEWTDHMMSVSNNGAASIVWREVVLMEAFGKDYPSINQEIADSYFKNTPKSELTDLGVRVVNQPLRKLGILEDEWRLGSFFTRGANTYIGNKGGSIGSPLGLMKFLIQMEQGKVVDEKSSLEMKRLMYMTDRRIRYAQAASLKDAAVYFKSGSLYKCDKTSGEPCGKYMGNIQNYMNSVAIIEHPNGRNYIVVLMSNVLRKNSASDHMFLAEKIDYLIKK